MESQRQESFGLGVFSHRGVDAQQPSGSLVLGEEVFVDAGGTLRGRGGLDVQVATGGAKSGVFVWTGALLAGLRTILQQGPAPSSSGDFYVINAAGTGVAVSKLAFWVADPVSAVVFGNALVEGNDDPAPLAPVVWGGSRKADWTGITNIVRTAGSAVITRAAGGFLANVDVGMYLSNWAVGGLSGIAVVKKIDSDTQITLDRPAPTTNTVTRDFFGVSAQQIIEPAATAVLGGHPAIYGTIAGRAVAMLRNRLMFSNGPDPTSGAPRTNDWPVKNLHEFPTDAEGIALAAQRGVQFVFTKAGIYTIAGMAYEIVDPDGSAQHPISLYSAETIALSQKGIVNWQGALIVPCRDEVYVMDGVSSPIPLSRGIPWAEMVRGGLVCGWATVFNGYYLLPVVYQGDAFTLVFRLAGVDSPVGTMFPTTTFFPPGGVQAWASSSATSLLGAGDGANGLLQGALMFADGGDGLDFDGTVVGGRAQVQFRTGTKGLTRRVRVRQSLPGISAAGCELRLYRAGASVASGVAGASNGNNWQAVDLAPAVESENVLVELRRVEASSEWVIKGLELQYRAFGGGY